MCSKNTSSRHPQCLLMPLSSAGGRSAVLGSPPDIEKTAVQDQYIELTSSIPSNANLFGLGEFTSNTGFPLRRDGLPYTLWTRDQPPAVPNTNLYGSHPIILDVRDSECF